MARDFGHLSRLLAFSLYLLNGAVHASEPMVFFEKEVRPLLINRCYECHSTEKKIKGGLALDTRNAVLKGGDSGSRPGRRRARPEQDHRSRPLPEP